MLLSVILAHVYMVHKSLDFLYFSDSGVHSSTAKTKIYHKAGSFLRERKARQHTVVRDIWCLIITVSRV